MPTVLVVDDDHSIQSLMRSLLELEGYEVRVAGDGQAALLDISEDRPDAVVLDIMMPELDGVAVLQRLQSVGVLANLPVIVLTGAPSLLLGRRCMALGARHVMRKPFDPDELLEVLARILSSDDSPEPD